MSIKKLLLMGMVFILTSCHSRYVSLDYEVYYEPVWNNDHNCIAFVASKTAYRSATGIAKFPDRGISEYLLKDVGLYVFYPENHQLTQLTAFNDLADLLGTSRIRWDMKIAFPDSVIYYRLSPTTKRDWYINEAKNSGDSLQVFTLKEKYTRTYSIDINNKKVLETDSLLFLSFYQKSINANKVDMTGLDKKLSGVPLADWGLVIKDIYPKADKEYIAETIYLRNNSPLARRAVVEQIIGKMNKQKIKDLLQKMDEYKNSLEGLKKMEFEIYSKDTYEKIQDLL